jgi:hypothetical protein
MVDHRPNVHPILRGSVREALEDAVAYERARRPDDRIATWLAAMSAYIAEQAPQPASDGT